MIAHINFMEEGRHLGKMELGQKRPREPEADLLEFHQLNQRRHPRSEMFKSGEGELESRSYDSLAHMPGSHNVVQHSEHGRSFKNHPEDVDSEENRLPNYGHMIGQLSNLGGDFAHRAQWHGSESAQQVPGFSEEKYKKIGVDRSGAEAASVLANLWGRRDDSDVQLSISARTLRPSGGKDRHSKVFTAKGPRDRRVRLSVSTAIQFYDVQDRLGYDQPSKAVEWLMKKAKAAIDELSQIPLPGLDRLSSSSHHPLGFGSASTSENAAISTLFPSNLHASSWPAAAYSGSTSEVLKSSNADADNSNSGATVVPKMVSSSEQQEEQQLHVDINNDRLSNRTGDHHNINVPVSIGGDASRNVASASTFPFRPMLPFNQNVTSQRDWKALLQQQPSFPGSSTFLQQQQQQQQQHQQEEQRLQQVPEHRVQVFQPAAAAAAAPLQYHHQQTSLITVQQTYLQQQEFLATKAGPAFHQSVVGPPFPHHHPRPYMDHQFHSLRVAQITGAGGATPSSDKPIGNQTQVQAQAARLLNSFEIGESFEDSSSNNNNNNNRSQDGSKDDC